MLAGIILEAVYGLGYGNVLAAVAGFASLIVADKLSLLLDTASGGDTIGVMQAVLDTQFWLATHVTCVVTGYSATYIAGLLGIIYVVRGALTPSFTHEESKDLARMIYGAVCFGMFFSFFGTVLGGLWADDSWGRFWGWDPKENAALIIVLWNALVLHARWDGMVKDRGLALLAIGGNIFASWSHFGVNQLGVGLHSYGFTEGVLVALGLFILSQLIVIGIGLIPLRYWLSSRRCSSLSLATSHHAASLVQIFAATEPRLWHGLRITRHNVRHGQQIQQPVGLPSSRHLHATVRHEHLNNRDHWCRATSGIGQ